MLLQHKNRRARQLLEAYHTKKRSACISQASVSLLQSEVAVLEKSWAHVQDFTSDSELVCHDSYLVSTCKFSYAFKSLLSLWFVLFFLFLLSCRMIAGLTQSCLYLKKFSVDKM